MHKTQKVAKYNSYGGRAYCKRAVQTIMCCPGSRLCSHKFKSWFAWLLLKVRETWSVCSLVKPLKLLSHGWKYKKIDLRPRLGNL